jgi:hypothetical protein
MRATEGAASLLVCSAENGPGTMRVSVAKGGQVTKGSHGIGCEISPWMAVLTARTGKIPGQELMLR